MLKKSPPPRCNGTGPRARKNHLPHKGLSLTFDDPRPPTHTRVPDLTGFSVVPAGSGTVIIEIAGEPLLLRSFPFADPAASGATRISGSLNFKQKYARRFPARRDRPRKPRPGDNAGRAGSPRRGVWPGEDIPGVESHFRPEPRREGMAKRSTLRGQRAAGTWARPARYQQSGFHLLPAGARLGMEHRGDRCPAKTGERQSPGARRSLRPPLRRSTPRRRWRSVAGHSGNRLAAGRRGPSTIALSALFLQKLQHLVQPPIIERGYPAERIGALKNALSNQVGYFLGK